MNTARSEDVIFTPDDIAADIVRHFKPTGRILDPCKGDGAFLRHMPGAEWCESREGRDFFAWTDPVDWIVSNPPYSNFGDWMRHSMECAENIVYLIPIAKMFSVEARMREVFKYGGIVETKYYGKGTDMGFPFGFPCGAVYAKKGYKGPMIWSFF